MNKTGEVFAAGSGHYGPRDRGETGKSTMSEEEVCQTILGGKGQAGGNYHEGCRKKARKGLERAGEQVGSRQGHRKHLACRAPVGSRGGGSVGGGRARGPSEIKKVSWTTVPAHKRAQKKPKKY